MEFTDDCLIWRGFADVMCDSTCKLSADVTLLHPRLQHTTTFRFLEVMGQISRIDVTPEHNIILYYLNGILSLGMVSGGR